MKKHRGTAGLFRWWPYLPAMICVVVFLGCNVPVRKRVMAPPMPPLTPKLQPQRTVTRPMAVVTRLLQLYFEVKTNMVTPGWTLNVWQSDEPRVKSGSVLTNLVPAETNWITLDRSQARKFF